MAGAAHRPMVRVQRRAALAAAVLVLLAPRGRAARLDKRDEETSKTVNSGSPGHSPLVAFVSSSNVGSPIVGSALYPLAAHAASDSWPDRVGNETPGDDSRLWGDLFEINNHEPHGRLTVEGLLRHQNIIKLRTNIEQLTALNPKTTDLSDRNSLMLFGRPYPSYWNWERDPALVKAWLVRVENFADGKLDLLARSAIDALEMMDSLKFRPGDAITTHSPSEKQKKFMDMANDVADKLELFSPGEVYAGKRQKIINEYRESLRVQLEHAGN